MKPDSCPEVRNLLRRGIDKTHNKTCASGGAEPFCIGALPGCKFAGAVSRARLSMPVERYTRRQRQALHRRVASLEHHS